MLAELWELWEKLRVFDQGLFAVAFHFPEFRRATQPSDASAAEVAAAAPMAQFEKSSVRKGDERRLAC